MKIGAIEEKNSLVLEPITHLVTFFYYILNLQLPSFKVGLAKEEKIAASDGGGVFSSIFLF